MTTCFLRIGRDYLSDAVQCESIKYAIAEFRAVAEELARFDQRIEASVHVAKTMDDVVEYPDYCLSLGPRGGVKIERC